MPGRERLPDTLKRSPAKAQRTGAKAHDSAVRGYGEGGRSPPVAYAPLKHSFAKERDKAAREGKGESFGGLDYEGSSRDELYERARKLDIPGRSKMNKKDLARAIAKRQ